MDRRFEMCCGFLKIGEGAWCGWKMPLATQAASQASRIPECQYARMPAGIQWLKARMT